jgi:hypothetical protein
LLLMFTEGAMTNPSKAFELMLNLLLRGVPTVAAPRRRRLPGGRCACHEPTVKWCGRHGEPRKRRTTVLA